MIILVAVNDIFFYAKLRDVLRAGGYTIERARSQDEVAAKSQALRPAALVLNMNDPGLDGLQALAQLKANDQLPALPVLAFANHEEVETWQRAKELGVTKIVSRNEFSSRTRELVEEVIQSKSSKVEKL
nr:response regulator [Nitrospirota bacterium]